MGISTGYGRTVTSGSVFAFDTSDVINSYKGEPTTNLLPSPGLNGYPTYGNSWATYNTNQYCGNNGCAVYWDIPAIASVSSNIVTTVSAHPIRSFDVINPETTGGGVTAGTNYLAKRISSTQFSLHAYNSSQDGSQGYINPSTGGFKVHDSYWLDERVSVNASSFPTKWWGAPHLPNSAIVKEIIPGGFTNVDGKKTDCIRLHWFRSDATDGMAYGADASFTPNQDVTISFWMRAVDVNAVGQSVYVENYTYGTVSPTDRGASKTIGPVGVWQKHSNTWNSPNSVAITYFFPSTGNMKVDIANIQIEQKSHATPFTVSNRSNTNAIAPLSGNSTIDLTNVSFDANAQMYFDGTNDYASVTLPSSIDVYCLEMVWYNNNAIPDNDTAIGGPSTYQTPISFNGTGQGVHLGAWTGGLTNEAIHIWGASGVTSNRVYAGVGYHHVVFNWNGTTYDIWVDGVNTKTYYGSGTNYATLITASSIKLGNDSDGYCFNGQIPVTKIYNRPLTQGEIRSNFDKHKKKLFKNSSSNPTHSAQILFDLGYRGDGAYWLRPPGSDTFQVPVKFLNGKALVCVMKGGGGNGFVPDSAYWENSTTLNASDFDLYNQQASKYASYSTIPFKEFYLQIGKTMYPVTFSLAAEVASMLAAQQRSWNDSANRSTPHYWNSQDYRTVPGADPDVTDIMGTEIYMYGMDLKHEGHYGGGAGSSGGRIRAGSILDESTGNTSPLSYGTAGSAFGIGVNGGNPLKTGVCGYAGWSNGSVINSTADWSLWIVN
jgi:hypothetical protein